MEAVAPPTATTTLAAETPVAVTGLKEMSPEIIETNVALMDPDLRHQMLQTGVPRHCIAVLAEAGFTSSKLFRCFGIADGSGSGSMEAVAKSARLMGLDPTKDLRSMAHIAKLQVVWSNTQAYEVAEERDRAEKRVLGITPSAKPCDYTVVRKQYEERMGKKQKKRLLPGNTVTDRMDAELESGEFRAPKLIEIPSKEEVDRAEEIASKHKAYRLSLC